MTIEPAAVRVNRYGTPRLVSPEMATSVRTPKACIHGKAFAPIDGDFPCYLCGFELTKIPASPIPAP